MIRVSSTLSLILNILLKFVLAFIQSLSVILSLTKMAMTVESYQRFESQKIVGKNYPWLAPHQFRRSPIRKTMSVPGEMSKLAEPAVEDVVVDDRLDRKTLNVNANNFNENHEKTLKEINFVSNITDDDKLITVQRLQIPDEVDSPRPESSKGNVPDDDLIENIDEIKEYLRKISNAEELDSSSMLDYTSVPSLPPPPRPTSAKHPYLDKLHQLSTLKDMMLFNAENFIKEKVPRIPEGMFESHSKEKEIKKEPTSPTSTTDENDILLPTRKTIVGGIENDDLVAKFISFLGWVMFLLMRMISLSMFSVFYLEICGWLCLGHYLFMLLCLINETRFKEKWQRTTFYFILAYIYIFNLMEFKIKFKSIRRWYIGYFLLVLSQNIAMTIAWYKFAAVELLESWWFEFMFLVILQSGIMSLMCLVLYFFYLKPRDKALFVDD